MIINHRKGCDLGRIGLYLNYWILRKQAKPMDLISYLNDQINFLTDQYEQAQKDQNVTMTYLVESRLDEAKKIMQAVHDGQITSLS